MPNLVGTGLNQVPTNSMLGGLAYQDPEHASIKDLDLKNLSQINSEITGTAVDIFIYDTSKDSDGGAWRKRTQYTSWYNETLGTATRGSRKEFPAVAVLVLQGTVFTIYDGDDPDLPMWMVFNKAGNSYFSVTTNSCVTALNGKIVSGGNASNDRLRVIDFLLDNELEYSNASTGQRTHLSPISGRNGTAGFTTYDSSLPGIVNRYVNDVAMTVLPNAPIDSATGLPVPTIAVATDGGVSIIKDDGTVVDWTESSGPNSTRRVSFRNDGKLGVFSSGTSGITGYPQLYYLDIPSADSSVGYYYNYSSGNFERYGGTAWESNSTGNLLMNNGSTSPGSATLTDMVDIPNLTYAATGDGLNAIIRPEAFSSGEADMTSASIAYIQKDYNTGYMVGDIKGAFLSDTDATNVTGTELWPEGDFADANEWSSAGAEWTISGGTATVSDANGGYSFLGSSTGTLTNGKKYVLSFTVSNYSGGRLEASQANSSNIQIPFSANGSYSQLINYTGTTGSGLGMYGYGGGAVGFTLDNLYLRELEEEDRSVNNTGLGVYGTITKSAVATGADLVAYSGFSASSYLLQPYNSDLDMGTGEFCVMGWFKASSSPTTAHRLYRRGVYNGSWSGGIYSGYMNANNTMGFNITPNGYFTIYAVTSSGTYQDGNWHHLVQLRNSSGMYQYIDGRLDGSNSSSGVQTTNLDNSTATLVLGGDQNTSATTYWSIGDMALWRISASAPSAEQIKKIYEDEKVLFQENAKCTLYGSSDAVTALAYDEVTEQLHVGTSSGRSDFQGLRRINNTTTAVTTAISAHDEFIVEQ